MTNYKTKYERLEQAARAAHVLINAEHPTADAHEAVNDALERALAREPAPAAPAASDPDAAEREHIAESVRMTWPRFSDWERTCAEAWLLRERAAVREKMQAVLETRKEGLFNEGYDAGGAEWKALYEERFQHVDDVWKAATKAERERAVAGVRKFYRCYTDEGGELVRWLKSGEKR